MVKARQMRPPVARGVGQNSRIDLCALANECPALALNGDLESSGAWLARRADDTAKDDDADHDRCRRCTFRTTMVPRAVEYAPSIAKSSRLPEVPCESGGESKLETVDRARRRAASSAVSRQALSNKCRGLFTLWNGTDRPPDESSRPWSARLPQPRRRPRASSRGITAAGAAGLRLDRRWPEPRTVGGGQSRIITAMPKTVSTPSSETSVAPSTPHKPSLRTVNAEQRLYIKCLKF